MPNVLIADDSIAVRKVAERLLIEAGLGVTLVANGEEALAYLAKETPDLVVSDVIMPDKSGYEVCAFVRGHRTLANTPVLLISGIVNDDVTKQAGVCRADGVLKKPFQGTSLKDRVLELLAKRQNVAAPVVKSIEKAAASIDQSQSARVSDDFLHDRSGKGHSERRPCDARTTSSLLTCWNARGRCDLRMQCDRRKRRHCLHGQRERRPDANSG